MRTNWRDVLIFAALAVSIPLIVILLIRFTPLPPVSEMKNAREALSQAGKDNADTYSKKLYSEALVFYDSAMINWKRQNSRFLYFRDYDRVLMFARLSSKKADEAAENSLGSTTNLRTKLKQKIVSLNQLVAEIDKLFTSYPLSAETRSRISNGKMLLQEADIVYKKGQYFQANRKITDSEYLLTTSYDNATSNLKNYFKAYSTWKNWADKAITASKKNRDYSIVIDKFSRKFFVYLNGTIKWEFDAELGKNWVGDKRVRGDNATPEGMYKITQKFDSNKTKYYKALLLDYPNEEDIANFRKEIARGSLPSSAKIGGLIEIHGNGGKGIDWTEGCIALTDKEMDVIYKIAKVGTPVTIVGSTIELKYIVNRDKLSEMEDDKVLNEDNMPELENLRGDAVLAVNQDNPHYATSEPSLQRKGKMAGLLRVFLFVLVTLVSFILLFLFILYIVPVLQEKARVGNAGLSNNRELKKDAAYKKQLALMSKDIQQLSRKYNTYTSGQSYIVINTTDNKFSLYKNKQLIREGLCSSGANKLLQTAKRAYLFKTPRGKFSITGKRKHPYWHRSDWDFIEQGLPVPPKDDPSRWEEGVLGDYALDLVDGYMIHGTIYKRLMGMPVTHGCVRLMDEDLEIVFNTLSIGSKVYIF